VVTKEMGEKLAKNYGIQHLEVSALTGENVQESYDKFISQLV